MQPSLLCSSYLIKKKINFSFSALFLCLKTQDKNIDPARRVLDLNYFLICSVKALETFAAYRPGYHQQRLSWRWNEEHIRKSRQSLSRSGACWYASCLADICPVAFSLLAHVIPLRSLTGFADFLGNE